MEVDSIANAGVGGIHCTRCTLYYPSKHSKCPHCVDLSDEEAKEFGQKFRNEAVRSNRPIAMLFLWLIVGILLASIIFNIHS